MAKSATRAMQFASLLLVSAAMVYGATGKAAAVESQAAVGVNHSAQADLGEGYMPKAGGRVIRRTNQAADGSTQVADSGKSLDLPGVGEGYVPKAGGRVIRRANQSAATEQQASAEACVTEPKTGPRC